ncbi:gamma-glutamyl-gamma-aminobutyrate hydrolase family protein [Rhodobacteraceae bacterium 2CG4]|uniref:gamma-glutamyl-gamma-aminobutyrate hydrolase n=1 Tax=Halovulum marinum TaxID=2662447 RepID=A0A6L5Z384_9RHOB|nr:gamma-glutamyl-gamma-aminobutyrate hydrolase family protein [Halovulum marinum]MSU90530.1 gamma-glutamyl-gamma-aminobutyrate hydrolase family protein [Halovulum marinum]
MSRPVVGIVGNFHLVNDQYPAQACGESNIEAVAQVAGALPLVLPARPDLAAVPDILDAVDGVVLPGGRPNVHPSFYGHDETEAHGTFDLNRDNLALPLIRACVEQGVPILGICRGFQEFNVAFGGTLHPEIRDLPGRMNHRMPPDGTLEEKFAHRHAVTLTPGGRFARILGADEVLVNTLHGQGITDPGARVVVEGHAPDGTPEAIHIDGARGFAMAVQWHPEWNAAADPVSRPLFEAFGAALRRGALRQTG